MVLKIVLGRPGTILVVRSVRPVRPETCRKRPRTRRLRKTRRPVRWAGARRLLSNRCLLKALFTLLVRVVSITDPSRVGGGRPLELLEC